MTPLWSEPYLHFFVKKKEKETKLTAQYYYLMLLNNISKVLFAGFSDLRLTVYTSTYNA